MTPRPEVLWCDILPFHNQQIVQKLIFEEVVHVFVRRGERPERRKWYNHFSTTFQRCSTIRARSRRVLMMRSEEAL